MNNTSYNSPFNISPVVLGNYNKLFLIKKTKTNSSKG